MTRVLKGFVILLAIVSVGLFYSSCNHDKTCTAVVKVVAADGTPVADAHVIMYATISTTAGPVTADIKAEGNTDGGGSFSVKFQLPAILDITVTKDTLSGQGIIKLEEKKTVTKTITIQ